MPLALLILVTAILTGCGTYKGNETWRRSTCTQIVDVDERARCEQEATRPESEYKQDVKEALDN
ncbi:hypothetical protein [Granulosicoccus antarcticus]|uniref:Uncharacterized protein n=1 Tax=Granulosicoccus antarcticus IMCC3135 TaxID=1192854 RepID=A0A2Z2P1Q4_9GAMM|nr:hypothetical protein [Granulosicoccus antarcticus]ASJ76775.1 hypothetical protein IMCC3135_33670 [Granulosicoccus antarcticus IMCC3135]